MDFSRNSYGMWVKTPSEKVLNELSGPEDDRDQGKSPIKVNNRHEAKTKNASATRKASSEGPKVDQSSINAYQGTMSVLKTILSTVFVIEWLMKLAGFANWAVVALIMRSFSFFNWSQAGEVSSEALNCLRGLNSSCRTMSSMAFSAGNRTENGYFVLFKIFKKVDGTSKPTKMYLEFSLLDMPFGGLLFLLLLVRLWGYLLAFFRWELLRIAQEMGAEFNHKSFLPEETALMAIQNP